MQTVVVRHGHAKPLWAGHPWVHAEAVHHVEGDPEPERSDFVRVADERGKTIGHGFLSPESSALRVRMFETGPEAIDPDGLLAGRIDAAALLRRRLFPRPSRTNAYRLVHAEGDGLPGLVVDRYGDLLVAQFATRPMHARRENLAARLLQATGASGLVARAGGFEREEGIAPDAIDFRVGAPPAEPLWVREEGLWFLADPLRGQKTGHYADQRENRVRVGELATGADVLDLYAGTGGFSLQALHHGARGTVAVDASGHALETARINAERNGLDSGLSAVEGDVRAVLQGMKDRGEVYGVVVLDPPNLFPRRGGDGRARKAYRDLNVQAVVRTAPRGFLASFSCSARMAPPDLRELLVSAGRECRRPLRFLRFLEAGPDHPVLGAAREGRYLCGWLAQVGS